MKEALTFDDVLLVPRASYLPGRDFIDISTQLGPIKLGLPIVSSPMNTVTESSMAMFMANNGGLGVIHRYSSIEDQLSEVRWCKDKHIRVGAAIGVNGDSWERTIKLIDNDVDLLVLDVAHGHTVHALKRIERIKTHFPKTVLCSANIATVQAANDCVSAGADILRVGLGNGSSCITRLVAGVGVPQLTALLDIRNEHNIPIISDGGIKNAGDIVKALVAGANAVMIGGLFASFAVAAGEVTYIKMEPKDDEPLPYEDKYIAKKFFRGMASQEALEEWKRDEPFIVEGESFYVDVDYEYQAKIDALRDGINLGLSYLGASNIIESRKGEFIKISPASMKENIAHFGGNGR